MTKTSGMDSDVDAETQSVAAIVAGFASIDESLLRPPALVLLGEANVGKSSIANCLLDRPLLPTSIIENTPALIRLRHAPALQIVAVTKDGRRHVDVAQIEAILSRGNASLEIGLPAERLKNLEIVDTPGNMGMGWLRTQPAPPDTRIAAWCTLATQAWKESERRTWAELPRELARDGILIVTNKDQLRSETDARSLRARLAAATRGQFRRIVFVSGRPPTDEDESPRASTWRLDSGIAELEAVLLARTIRMRRRRLRKVMRIVQRLHRLVQRSPRATGG